MDNEKAEPLPERVMIWRSQPTTPWIGTWATTRYAADAVEYVPAGSKAKGDDDRRHGLIEGVLIGGNHLACHLPENHPPFDTDPLDALEQIGAGIHYDVWCAWATIMKARDILEALTLFEQAISGKTNEP